MIERDQKLRAEETAGGSSDLMTVGFVLAALGSLTMLLAKFIESRGDEAPIRVRGGSIYVDILCTDHTWEQNPSGVWKFKNGGNRDKDNYKVTISSKKPSPVSGRKQTIKITTRDATLNTDAGWVEIRSSGKRTRVTSSAALALKNAGQTLCYETADTYVSRIGFEDGMGYDFEQGDFDCLKADD